MAAYAAVISLKHTIKTLFNSSCLSYTREILELACNQTISLKKLLQKFDEITSKRIYDLEGKIRDAAHQLEDVLEFYESLCDEGLSQEVTSFLEGAKKIEAEYEELVIKVSEEDEEDGDGDGDGDASVSPNCDDGVEMVGHEDEFTHVRHHLLERMRPDDLCFFPYVGEAGTGRSVIGKTILEDERERFDCSAWVTIGTKYEQYKEVAIRILDQVVGVGDDESVNHELLLLDEDERMISNYLYKALEHRRYLIVLDDVRSVEVLDYLRKSFPDQSNGSLVFLTTNRGEVAKSAQCMCTFVPPVGYMEQWSCYYLKLALFGENALISPELDQALKKISENCGGRVIALAKTLLFLIKTEKTVEEWSKIAADKEHSIFMVEDEISEIGKIQTEMQLHNWHMDEQREDCTSKFIAKWIDFSGSVDRIKKTMYPKRFFSKMQLSYLWGMAGIGKTTYAKKIIQDESILCHYDHCVWVTLGPKYQTEEILIDILAQIYPSIAKMRMKEDEKLVKELCAQLSGKRCFIVVDDLRSGEPLHHLKRLFPDIKGRALVTTRLVEVIIWGGEDMRSDLRLLDKEESWTLLRQKVFADGICPPELEESGRKIADKCDGLPLLVLKVANQLLRVEKDPKYWNHVASEKESVVFMNAHEEISKELLPSYKSLPQHFKACFLYIGAFRKRYDISTSKLTIMLMAEGFLEHIDANCFAVLIGKSVLMVEYSPPNFRLKTCRLHSVFWYLCNSEAEKTRFFHAMNVYDDCFEEKMKRQRRLCIRNSILLGFKDVQESMASITSAHSLLCVSPPHQYPVPICFDLKLLRVMDALAIRQYMFPIEVVKLLHLRFLTLTFCGRLPISISYLWKLQYLIVSRYMNIKSSENSSLLPMEIWDMKELKHLQIMGGLLPNPNPECGAGLPNLSSLLDVSAQSCTEEVLEMIPNLKRLGIRIELAPDDGGNSFDILNNISRLCGLESLKCVVVNPQFSSKMAPPPAPVSMFPSSLKRLSLSGFGYPWEYMSIIGGLRNLEVLKLKSYAFRGPKWEMDCVQHFYVLKFLVIEDTDLVQWEIKVPVLNKLECLRMNHCYKLKMLPSCLPMLDIWKKLEIVDCNPLTVTWAEQMRKQLVRFHFEAHLSWINPKK